VHTVHLCEANFHIVDSGEVTIVCEKLVHWQACRVLECLLCVCRPTWESEADLSEACLVSLKSGEKLLIQHKVFGQPQLKLHVLIVGWLPGILSHIASCIQSTHTGISFSWDLQQGSRCCAPVLLADLYLCLQCGEEGQLALSIRGHALYMLNCRFSTMNKEQMA